MFILLNYFDFYPQQHAAITNTIPGTSVAVMVTTPCLAQNVPATKLVSVSVRNIAMVTVFGRMANAKKGLDLSDHHLFGVSMVAIIIN